MEERYSGLTKQQAQEIVDKIRLETIHRCNVPVTGSLVHRDKGFMVAANISGKAIVFRSVNEFAGYCETLPSYSTPDTAIRGISGSKLTARVKFMQEIFNRTTKAHFSYSSTKFIHEKQVFHKNIKYYVKDSGKCRVFEDIKPLKEYLLKVLGTASKKEPNPVKKVHLKKYMQILLEGVDTY